MTVQDNTINIESERLKTPMENLKEQGAIAKNMFVVDFQPVRTHEDIGTAGGSLTLGGLPGTLSEDQIMWTPLANSQLKTAKNYWSLAMDSVQIGERTVDIADNGIVDTGTTMIMLHTDKVKTLFTGVQGISYNRTLDLWTAPCKTVQKLPDVTFHFGQNALKLTAEQYTVPAWQRNYWGSEDCPLYITSDDALDEFGFIIGQKFLENYISVYDGEARRVGFAAKNA